MSIESQDNKSQDDQVLAKLFKQGAKDTPPAKLNSEILNYAATANKSSHRSTSNSNAVGSHFGGGWKVPLSMAASVVVVFALLVQLDQTPQQLELPPIPEISTPVESKQAGSIDEALKSAPALEEMNEAVDDEVIGTQDTKESDFDSALDTETAQESVAEELIIQEAQTPTLQKPKITKKPPQKLKHKKAQEQQPSRERVHQAPVDVKRTEERLLENRSNQAAPSAPTASSSKSMDSYAPKMDKAQTIERTSQEPTSELESKSAVTSGSVMEERSMQQQAAPTREDALGASDMAAESQMQESSKLKQKQEQEYAPIPVENWLLMIEKLVARKDYAEAARQLQKFKQTHPNVNVEDLESQIP